MIKTNIAETKRDVKRDFRGILAIKLRHSLPRHSFVRLTLKVLDQGQGRKFCGANLRKGGLHLWSSPLFFG